MKIRLLCQFLFSCILELILLSPAGASQQVYKKLSEAYESQNLKSKIAELERESIENQKELQQAKQKMKWKLQSGAEATLSFQENSASSRIPSWSLAGNLLTVTQAHQLTASKTLFDFGRSDAAQARLNARNVTVEISESSAKRTAQREALRDTFALAKARERLQTTKALFAAAKKKTELFEESFKRGDRSTQDVLLAQIQQNRVKQSVEAADSEHLQLQEQISQKSDLPASAVSEAALVAHSPQQIVEMIQRIKESFLQDEELHENPDWLILESQKTLLQAELEAIDSDSMPIVLGNFGTRIPGQLTPLKPQIYAGLTFEWVLPTNGEYILNKEGILNQKKQLDIRQQELIEAQRKQEAATALGSASFNREWIVMQTQEKLLKDWDKAVKDRLKSGRATAIDAAAAEDALVNLELEKWNFLMRWRERIFERALVQENWPMLISFFKD